MADLDDFLIDDQIVAGFCFDQTVIGLNYSGVLELGPKHAAGSTIDAPVQVMPPGDNLVC